MPRLPRRGPKEWAPFPEDPSKWTLEELQKVFEQPPFASYGDKWFFDYEYPGYFVYYHQDVPVVIHFTPDFHDYGTVGVQVTNRDEGTEIEIPEHVPFREDRRPEVLFDIVRPYLDKYKDWQP